MKILHDMVSVLLISLQSMITIVQGYGREFLNIYSLPIMKWSVTERLGQRRAVRAVHDYDEIDHDIKCAF